MKIDVATLAMVIGLASLLSSVVFAGLFFFGRRIPALGLWAIGCGLIGLAMVFDGPRLTSDWRWLSIMFNAPIMVGQSFLLAGILDFCGRSWRRMLWLAAAVGFSSTFAFTFVFPDTRLRIGALALQLVLMAGYAGILLWRHADPRTRLVYRLASFGCFLQAACTSTHGFVVATNSTPLSYATPELPFSAVIAFSGLLVNSIFGNWMLFMLVGLRLMDELEIAATRDPLTGLLNRRGFKAASEALRLRTRAEHVPLAVLLLDIDFFKRVNDTLGHDGGDRVLGLLGEVLRAVESRTRIPARWGGEEFCLAVAGEPAEPVGRLAERVRAEFAEATRAVPGLAAPATCSVGIVLDERGRPLPELIKLADEALYAAKDSGRDRVEWRQ